MDFFENFASTSASPTTPVDAKGQASLDHRLRAFPRLAAIMKDRNKSSSLLAYLIFCNQKTRPGTSPQSRSETKLQRFYRFCSSVIGLIFLIEFLCGCAAFAGSLDPQSVPQPPSSSIPVEKCESINMFNATYWEVRQTNLLLALGPEDCRKMVSHKVLAKLIIGNKLCSKNGGVVVLSSFFAPPLSVDAPMNSSCSWGS
jgi:hypothetical protein